MTITFAAGRLTIGGVVAMTLPPMPDLRHHGEYRRGYATQNAWLDGDAWSRGLMKKPRGIYTCPVFVHPPDTAARIAELEKELAETTEQLDRAQVIAADIIASLQFQLDASRGKLDAAIGLIKEAAFHINPMASWHYDAEAFFLEMNNDRC